MEVKIQLVSMGLFWFLCQGGHCLRISRENNIWEEDLAAMKSNEGVVESEFYQDLPTGPEKLPIEVFEVDKNALVEEAEKEKISDSVVDEETIRKAEKAADKDLLSGLNRILKNNETLKDVFRTENDYEIL